MKKNLFLMVLFVGGIGSAAQFDDLAAGHAASEALLAQKVIHLSSAGDVQVQLPVATALLTDDDLLQTVQRAYSELRPERKVSEVTVRKTGAGRYLYRTPGGRSTLVEEVGRRCEADQITVLYYAEGERFFGRFEVLMQLVLKEEVPGRCGYEVKVAAYPESSLVRWFGRTRLMRRFFRNKTDELIGLAVAVTDRMI